MTKKPARKSRSRETIQPDPMLHEGRSSRLWVWTIGAVIVLAIVGTFFAGNSHQQSAQNRPDRAPVTTGSGSTPPQSAEPAGRGTSKAPLTGKSTTVR
jgi:hypothetical protein